MNRRPPGLKTERAILGFLQFKAAEGLSSRTIESYRHDLHLWLEFQGEVNLEEVTPMDLRQYLLYMLNEYKPRRIAGSNEQKLSPKTVRNIWVTFRAFFGWLNVEFEYPNPMKKVAPPKFETPPVEPYSKQDIEVMLKACDHCQEAQTNGRRKFTMKRPTALRDKALILMLLDTGLRASELCALNVEDVDIKKGKVIVKHGSLGGAKGRKGRIVYMGKTFRKAVWRYLASREDGEELDAPLFVGLQGRRINRDTLRQVIASLGKKAGIQRAYTHRFRHTFGRSFGRLVNAQ